MPAVALLETAMQQGHVDGLEGEVGEVVGEAAVSTIRVAQLDGAIAFPTLPLADVLKGLYESTSERTNEAVVIWILMPILIKLTV